MIIEIKDKWGEKVLYSGEFESLREAVLAAIEQGIDLRFANLESANLESANLESANLEFANLESANLTSTRDDFWAVLCGSPKEVFALRAALIDGKVDGSAYQGECACLVGTIANAKHCNYQELTLLKPNCSRLAEKWFLGIRPGDTTENSAVVKLTLEWLDTFVSQMQAAFGEAEVPTISQ